jgi:hypothetical protein
MGIALGATSYWPCFTFLWPKLLLASEALELGPRTATSAIDGLRIRKEEICPDRISPHRTDLVGNLANQSSVTVFRKRFTVVVEASGSWRRLLDEALLARCLSCLDATQLSDVIDFAAFGCDFSGGCRAVMGRSGNASAGFRTPFSLVGSCL